MLIALAVLKPWGSLTGPDAGPTTAAGPGGAAAAASASTAGPSPETSAATTPSARSSPVPDLEPTEDPRAIQCLGPQGWRIVTLQQTDALESRSWIVIRPTLGATGPGDAAIQTFRLSEQDITAIGFCGDDQHQGTPPAVLAEAWQQGASGEWRILTLAASRLGALDGGGAATVYAPARGPAPSEVHPRKSSSGSGASANPAVPGSSEWPAGRYAFKVTVLDSPATIYWFRVDLRWPPDPTGSPLP